MSLCLLNISPSAWRIVGAELNMFDEQMNSSYIEIGVWRQRCTTSNSLSPQFPSSLNTYSSLIIAPRKILRPYLPAGYRPNTEYLQEGLQWRCISHAVWHTWALASPPSPVHQPEWVSSPLLTSGEASDAAVWDQLVWKLTWIITHLTHSWALSVASNISGAVK